MLDKIVKILFRSCNREVTINDFVINDYLSKMDVKDSIDSRVTGISDRISSVIIDIVAKNYSDYPKWVINAYLDRNSIRSLVLSAFRNDNKLISITEELEKKETLECDTSVCKDNYLCNNYLNLCIYIIFNNIDIPDNSNIWNIEHFRYVYNTINIFYVKFINDY